MSASGLAVSLGPLKHRTGNSRGNGSGYERPRHIQGIMHAHKYSCPGDAKAQQYYCKRSAARPSLHKERQCQRKQKRCVKAGKGRGGIVLYEHAAKAQHKGAGIIVGAAYSQRHAHSQSRGNYGPLGKELAVGLPVPGKGHKQQGNEHGPFCQCAAQPDAEGGCLSVSVEQQKKYIGSGNSFSRGRFLGMACLAV